MSARFSDYLAAAFSWRPLGMFVAPNWLGLAGFGLAGLLNPGFWILGAGLELAYLFALVNNGRFRALVDREAATEADGDVSAALDARVARLDPNAGARFRALRERCEGLLPGDGDDAALADALGHLLQAALDLLETRARILEVVSQGETDPKDLRRRRDDVGQRLADRALDEELRRSLNSQAELLDRRLAAWQAGVDKLAVVAAELQRIEDQVALLREQAILDADPAAATRRVDTIASTLATTDAWLSEQRALYGIEAEASDNPIPLRRAAARTQR